MQRANAWRVRAVRDCEEFEAAYALYIPGEECDSPVVSINDNRLYGGLKLQASSPFWMVTRMVTCKNRPS